MKRSDNPSFLTLPRAMYDRLTPELEALGKSSLPPAMEQAFDELDVRGMNLRNIYPAKDGMIHSQSTSSSMAT